MAKYLAAVLSTLLFLSSDVDALGTKLAAVQGKQGSSWCLIAPGLVIINRSKSLPILAQFDGNLSSIAVKPGDRVEKGQEIATLLRAHALGKDIIFSPVAGQVINFRHGIGSFLAVGQEILRLNDSNQLWARISLPLGKRLNKLAFGQPVVKLMSPPYRDVNLVKQSKVVNPKTQSLDLTVELDQLLGSFRPGTWLKMKVCWSERLDANATEYLDSNHDSKGRL